MPSRPDLIALADRAGILGEYRDTRGRIVRTTDRTRAALLHAMGLDVSTVRRARRALAELERVEGEGLLAPVSVQTPRPGRGATVELGSSAGVSDWRMELTLESGDLLHLSGKRGGGDKSGPMRVRLPADLPLGYHEIHGEARVNGRTRSGRQSLIVCPSTCWTWREALGDRRAAGVWTHLYTLRSGRNWGIGDLTDLHRLAAWAGALGAEFIGLNPLHALANRGHGISPYSPLSRLFRNPIYLDVERVPEVRQDRRAQAQATSREFRERVESARRMVSHEGGGVPYERVIELKEELLRLLFAEFKRRHLHAGSVRGRAFAQYVESGGRVLEDFGTFMAMAEIFSFRRGVHADWRDWPPEYHDPRGPAVARFRRRSSDDVDLHRYLQFEVDRQVAEVHAKATGAGMTLGLYHDLAVGSDGGGFDAWALSRSADPKVPALFVEGATMGAPPDSMARDGQDWRFPPLHPVALRATGYDYWVRLLRSNMRGGGMLRIDHVMGLFRQYWIPQGMSGRHGGYVRFPSADLLGILALESRRNRVVVVGEDLGTVAPQVPRELKRRGILSTRVLHFERTGRGAFRSARSMSNHALLVAGTHDLPPLGGYVRGEDIPRRYAVCATRPAGSQKSGGRREVRRQRMERRRDVDALVRRLVAEGLLSREGFDSAVGGGEPGASRLRALADAVHLFISRSPAPLVGVALDDLAGEAIPLNLPGLPPESGFCWRRVMRALVEEIVTDSSLRRRLSRIIAEGRRSPVQRKGVAPAASRGGR